MNVTMITQQHIFSSFYWQNRPAPKVQIYLWATSSFPPVWGNPPNVYCIPYFFYANLSKTGTVTLRHKGQKQNQIFLPWFYAGGGFQASLKVLLRNIITPHFCPDFLRATPSLELGKTLPLDFFFTAATQDNLTRKRGTHSRPVPAAELVPASTVDGPATTGRDPVQWHRAKSSAAFDLFWTARVLHVSLFLFYFFSHLFPIGCCLGKREFYYHNGSVALGCFFFSFFLSLHHTVRRRRLLCHIFPWTMQSAMGVATLGEVLPHILFPFCQGVHGA